MAIPVIREVAADVVKRGATRAVYAKQNDVNSRFLNIRIQEDGKDIVIQPHLTVMLNVERPDRQENMFYGTVNDDGTVQVPLTSWMLELPGTLICDVSIVSEDPSVAKLTTMLFNIYVEEAVVSDKNIIETEEYSIIIDLLNRTSAAAELAVGTVTRCEKATKNANEAAASANQARSTLLTENTRIINELLEERGQIELVEECTTPAFFELKQKKRVSGVLGGPICIVANGSSEYAKVDVSSFGRIHVHGYLWGQTSSNVYLVQFVDASGLIIAQHEPARSGNLIEDGIYEGEFDVPLGACFAYVLGFPSRAPVSVKGWKIFDISTLVEEKVDKDTKWVSLTPTSRRYGVCITRENEELVLDKASYSEVDVSKYKKICGYTWIHPDNPVAAIFLDADNNVIYRYEPTGVSEGKLSYCLSVPATAKTFKVNGHYGNSVNPENTTTCVEYVDLYGYQEMVAVKTINGIEPDENGNIYLPFDEILFTAFVEEGFIQPVYCDDTTVFTDGDGAILLYDAVSCTTKS